MSGPSLPAQSRLCSHADHARSVLCTAIRSLAPRFVGRTLMSLTENMGITQRKLQSGQIRFMSPERGVLQLATCAVLNAIWDLWAKAEKKPLWRLITDFTPEEFVRAIDFRYISGCHNPGTGVENAREKGEKRKQSGSRWLWKITQYQHTIHRRAG